jgi:SSS family transporter
MLAASVVIYLFFTLIIGYWASKKVKTADDFAVAGRKLPFYMSSAALFATWFGSETILGSTEEFLKHGLIGVIEEPLGAALCLLIVGFFYAKRMYRTNAYTFSDVFGRRFGRSSELVSAIVMIPSFFSWIAAQFIALAMIFQLLFGLSFTEGIFAGTILVVLYTSMGGMWAVSWADTIQTAVIIFGLIAILIYFLAHKDISEVYQNSPDGFLDLYNSNRLSWMEWLGAWCTIGLGSVASQDIFQRVVSARSERVAILSSVSASILYLLIGIIPLLIVWIGSHYFPEFYDKNQGNFISALIMEKTPLWIRIIYFGALVSALLSTASGAILAPATVLAENVLNPIFRKKELLTMMRFGVVIIAALSAIICFTGSSIFELAGQASVFSLVSVFIPFSFTLFYSKTTRTGVNTGMVIGLMAWGVASLFDTKVPAFFIGMAVSFCGVLIGNFIENRKNNGIQAA